MLFQEEDIKTALVTLGSVTAGDLLLGKESLKGKKILLNSIYSIILTLLKKKFPIAADPSLKEYAKFAAESILANALATAALNYNDIDKLDAKKVIMSGIIKAIEAYAGQLVADNM